MSQSWRMSLVEAATNTAVGYALAVGTQLVVFPFYGLDAALPQHLGIAAVFVVVSLLRSYALRRAFERLRKPRLAVRRTRWHDHRLPSSQPSVARTSEAD